MLKVQKCEVAMLSVDHVSQCACSIDGVLASVSAMGSAWDTGGRWI